MSKRNQKIKLTKEAKALKRMRVESNLSLRKLGDRMNLSFTRIHQMESGREDISQEYIDLFLEAIGKNRCVWKKYLGSPPPVLSLREKCQRVLENVEDDKLEIIYGILSSF